jgi:hypothetical protein
MIVLADNDIVHKLARCELLPELLIWLKAPPAQIWVLPSMPFILRRKLKADAAALACLERFLKLVKPIPVPSIATIGRFAQLDVGERQMLAILVDDAQVTQMVTGDKRALKLMAEIASTDHVLAGRLTTARIDCLESIMLGLINQFGFAAINAKAIRGVTADIVLHMSFGAKRPEAHAVEALTSYLADVQSDARFVASK